MDQNRTKLRNTWAKNFPEISEEWFYWWIEGNGVCLAPISGDNLAGALDIVEDYWERYDSIKAYKAKRLDDDILRRQKNAFEISNLAISRKILGAAEDKI